MRKLFICQTFCRSLWPHLCQGFSLCWFFCNNSLFLTDPSVSLLEWKFCDDVWILKSGSMSSSTSLGSQIQIVGWLLPEIGRLNINTFVRQEEQAGSLTASCLTSFGLLTISCLTSYVFWLTRGSLNLDWDLVLMDSLKSIHPLFSFWCALGFSRDVLFVNISY